MKLVSKILVSGSMLALGMGMMGSAASASVINTNENVQSTLVANPYQDFRPFNNIFDGPDQRAFFGVAGISANNVIGNSLTAQSNKLLFHADPVVLENAGIVNAYFVPSGAQEKTTEGTISANGNVYFELPDGAIQNGAVYLSNGQTFYHVFSTYVK